MFVLARLLIFTVLLFPVAVHSQSDDSGSAGTTTFGMVVDNSGTFRLAIDRAIRLLTPFIMEKDEPARGFLVVFSEPERILIRQDPTDDIEELVDALENMHVLPGRSAVWDAIGIAAGQFPEESPSEGERRILVVVTDGDEKGSIARPASVIASLRERSIEVYVVGMAEQRISERMIDRLVRETGGKKLIAQRQDDLLRATAELTEMIWRSK